MVWLCSQTWPCSHVHVNPEERPSFSYTFALPGPFTQKNHRQARDSILACIRESFQLGGPDFDHRVVSFLG